MFCCIKSSEFSRAKAALLTACRDGDIETVRTLCELGSMKRYVRHNNRVILAVDRAANPELFELVVSLAYDKLDNSAKIQPSTP